MENLLQLKNFSGKKSAKFTKPEILRGGTRSLELQRKAMNHKRQLSFRCEQYQSAYNVLENITQESPGLWKKSSKTFTLIWSVNEYGDVGENAPGRGPLLAIREMWGLWDSHMKTQ